MARSMKSHGTIVAEEINRDPEFRAEWERTALARLVAAELVGYRADHELSQRALAERLGCSQPYVAKLESGETNPNMETLVNLSRALGVEFVIDIAPVKQTRRLVTKAVAEKVAQEQDGVSVVLAASAPRRRQ
jgi:transcriptional regulator with XRE-family HTH domain